LLAAVPAARHSRAVPKEGTHEDVDISIQSRLKTFVLAVRQSIPWLRSGVIPPADSQPVGFQRTFRLGIAARLAISFAAVAVLAVVANLIVEGKVSVLRTTEVRQERVTPAAPVTTAAVQPVAPVPTPAPVRRPFPSTDAVLHAMDRLEHAVDTSTEGDVTELSARYQKLATELDRAASAFTAAATAAGESPPARFMVTLRSYRQHGADLVELTASRRKLMAGYSSHFEQLNTRVKRSLDHAWNIFGRVVARQSLVKLTGDLDALRRQYVEFVAADTVDSSTFDTLGASEGALAQTLTQDRAGFTRADGQDWYTKSQDDLQAMSAARKALLQIDRARKAGARKFAEDASAVSQILGRMGKTETYVARHNVAAASAGGQPVAAGGQPTSASGGTMAGGQHASAPGSTVAGGQSTFAAGGATGAGQHAAQAGAKVSSLGAAAQGAVASVGNHAATAADSFVGEHAPASGTPPPAITAATTDSIDTQMQSSVDTTTLDPHTHQRKTLIAWLSGGVLLLVVYISASTVLSIVRPVRRLMTASARIAKGEGGIIVPRGGIRELDTLAIAFNDMAAQLAVAQEAARDQQYLLEAKVDERTLQLQELAQLDPLTRLANRRHFFTLLNAAIDTATREKRLVGVFFLDVDNFKNMNDSLGHEFGDQVLQNIATRLAESTRSFGFAARVGGDEFTVVYESASNIEDIRAAGLQLIEAFQEPMQLDGRDLIVSISAGASVFPQHAQNVEALLRAADAALYEAKALGRSQLALFTPALLEAATERFHTEQGLRRALDRGEFELVFQPEVNLQTCEVELVEALLRWRRPDGHLAAPGEFLAVAEASGLILQINDWVLRRVIETAARWHHGHWPNVRIAINVSSRQLFDNSFVEQVQELLEQHKLPPRCIEIELTENVLQTGSATIASLRRLRAHGIAIALDDFGTGFSSLTSLEQLPLTRIKLDRSLIASIDTSARSAAIAKAIIQLCQGLGLAITAEGIERPEQLAPLVGYPALYAQGYLLSRPQSIDELLPAIANLPAITRALVRSTIARLPETQLAEALPHVTAVIKH
jgi:diguanylate cyclase (GGDEF)-like protein